MADIKLRSYQEIVGIMIAKLMAQTDLNDVSQGSVFLTLLEAAASSDFSTEGRLLQLLNLRNIDKASGVDLENLAYEMGLLSTRLGAEPANVSISVIDSGFQKKSTNIYAGSTSPSAGEREIKVIDASSFSASGTIHVGRGTPTYESIQYVSVQDTGSYWRVFLSAPLTKDHLVGEEVILGQGGIRTISSGTLVSSAGSEVSFTTSVDASLQDGDNFISGIPAIATSAGIDGNVGIGKIIQFASKPWSTASVTNEQAASGGRDAETDPELRQRIKDHVHNIGKGTKKAIVSAIVGTSDGEEGKRVVSAFLREPTSSDQRGILFIDDGTGFSPSYSGIGEEVVVTKAVGTESFFQLQRWPLVKSQVASVGIEPFALYGGESLYVEVDGEYEERSLSSSSFKTPGVVLAQEVAEAINKTFISVEARAKDGLVFISPVSDDPDYIRVGNSTSNSDANLKLRFPTRRQYTIRLYKNNTLLEKNGSDAVVQTKPYVQWPVFSTSETLRLNVDGILGETITITNNDFAALSGSNTITGATVADWAKVLNKKFIGITAIAKDDGTFIIRSNKGSSPGAYIEIVTGTNSHPCSLKEKIFGTVTVGEGKDADYKLNRLLGQIQLNKRLSAGDELKAGTVKTAGSITSSAQASYDLSKKDFWQYSQPQVQIPAELVIVPDYTAEIVPFAETGSNTFLPISDSVQRITGENGQYSDVRAGDWCYLYNLPRSGLFKVKEVAQSGAYVDLFDPSPVSATISFNLVNNTVRFFRTAGVPQICVLPSGPSVPGDEIISSINSQILGVTAELTDSGAIKVYSNRLASTGGFALIAAAGSATNLNFVIGSYESNDPHVAVIESSDLTGIPTGRIVIENPDVIDPFDNIQSINEVFDEYQDANRGILTYIGAADGYIHQPLIRTGTDGNSLVVRNLPPYQKVGFGKDMRGTKLSWVEFGQEDNMVFLIDNDAAKKTFDVPLYVDVLVSGSVPPTSSQFDLVDLTGAKIGSSSKWSSHNFNDYKIWFQARSVVPSSLPNSSLKATAIQYGPIGSHISFGVFYPTAPASDSTVMYSTDHSNATFFIDPEHDKILIQLMLASGDERLIGLTQNKRIYIDATPRTTNIPYYKKRVTFLSPVDLSTVIPGDIISITDTSANQANRGQMRIDEVYNLVDYGMSYQFLEETVTGTLTVNGSERRLILDSQSEQSVRPGDKVQLAGIRKQIQTVYNNSITKAVGGVGTNEIVLKASGSFKPANGTFVVNNITFKYDTYAAETVTTGGSTTTSYKFKNVTPNPAAEPGKNALVNIDDILVQNNYIISVPSGGNFTPSMGSLQINGVNFSYNSYNSSSGYFDYVTPNPTGIATVGSNVNQTIYSGPTALVETVTTDQMSIALATPSKTIDSGSGYVFKLTHKCLNVSGSPGFIVKEKDIVQVGSNIMRVTNVIDQSHWDVDNPFCFTAFQSGIVSRIYVEGKCAKECVNDSFQTLSGKTCQIYDLPNNKNKVSDLKKTINETAGVKDLIYLSDAPGSDGSGYLDYSTEDELMTTGLTDGSSYVYLKNGESFILSTDGQAPCVSLKEHLDEAPFIGDKARLIPSTPQNIYDHFSRKQITGLTIAANVDLVDNGRRVQISSKVSGGSGQVFAVGGRGSGLNTLALRGTTQEISVNRGLLEFDRSATDILATGQTIKLSQIGRAKKKFTQSQPSPSTSLSVLKLNTTTARLTLGVPLVSTYGYAHSSNVIWAVKAIGRNRMRFEVFSGEASIPAALRVDDWVLVGNGESYANITPAQVFSSGNQGWYQVLETDNSTYFDVENYGLDEFVKTSTQPFVFTSYHSARVGDQVVIGSDTNLEFKNLGSFIITNVPSLYQIDYRNSDAISHSGLTIGSTTNGVSILDQGYTTYRKVVIVNPKPNDPTNRAQVVVSPGYNIQLFNENQGARLSLPTRLGFNPDPTPGMAGYQFWTGLKRRAQRVVDGYEPDSSTFPGARASGAQIEVREPQIQRVTIQLKIKTSKGVSLQSLSDTIKSEITGYINSLGLGQDVVLSECIRLAQDVPGVDSVVMAYPSPGSERITINSNAIARISSQDVTLS